MVGRRARLRIDIGRFYTEWLGRYSITLNNLTMLWIHVLIRLFKLCRDSSVFGSAQLGTYSVPKLELKTHIPEIGIVLTHDDYGLFSHPYDLYDG